MVSAARRMGRCKRPGPLVRNKGALFQIPHNLIPGDMWNVVETGTSWIYCVP